MSPWPLVASFSLPNTSSTSLLLSEALPEYCSSINTTPSCCCWCHLPQPLLPPCWIKKEETWLFRTCVERGGAVRSVLGSPVIRITSCSTTSSPFFERFRSRSTRYVDASIHSLLDELLDDLGETSRKFFVFCNVPNSRTWAYQIRYLGLGRRMATIQCSRLMRQILGPYGGANGGDDLDFQGAFHLQVLHLAGPTRPVLDLG